MSARHASLVPRERERSALESHVHNVQTMSPITLNCRTVAPFWVSETRQGYVVVVVVAVFTTVIITYYTIISTNSLYIMKLLRSAAST